MGADPCLPYGKITSRTHLYSLALNMGRFLLAGSDDLCVPVCDPHRAVGVVGYGDRMATVLGGGKASSDRSGFIAGRRGLDRGGIDRGANERSPTETLHR